MKDSEEIREWYQEHRRRVETDRMRFAKTKLECLGYHVTESIKCLIFEHKGNTIRFYPYTGWFTGKGIKDGRGLEKLLRQLKRQ